MHIFPPFKWMVGLIRCRNSSQHMHTFSLAQGDYVVLASEPVCIVGIDVAAPQQLRRPGSQTTLVRALEPFRKQLSEAEVGI
jgi:hypothetical protein